MHALGKFSCFIIGEETLPIQCAEILLNSGHRICGIISSEAAVIHWAKERGLPHLEALGDLRAFISRQPFDYLFSIANSYILPQEVLELPGRYAINYHDAPLPRYAGSYATSWAIMNGERVHGVTWHVMSERVGADDILRQCSVTIAEGETALTLNMKCYEAAIRSFAELIDDLSCGRVSTRRQNLNKRIFFPRSKRPPIGCVLSWNHYAHDISALIRALDFGSYPNPLGLPKLAIAGEFLIVCEVEILDSWSKVPPGTVTNISHSSLQISTASREIMVRKLLTIDGQPLSVLDTVARFGLREGYRFKDVDPELARRITEHDASICKHEAFWVKRLAALQPLTPPYATRNVPHAEQAWYVGVSLRIPEEVTTFLADHQAAWGFGAFLLAAFGTYLARSSGVYHFDIGFRDTELRRDLAGLEGLFAPQVPWRVALDSAQSFVEVYRAVQEQVGVVRQHKTYARDIVARHRTLRSVPELRGMHALPVSVELVEKLGNDEVLPGSMLTLIIPEEGTECRWVYDAKVLDGSGVTRMLQQFNAFLQTIATYPHRHIADLLAMTPEECHQLLIEFNDTAADYPEDLCIHQLFETQVERTPDAVAVVYEEHQLTYQELNCRANQLAHYLRRHGVGPEILVGICVERSLEMMVGLLGILKVGGAYVPLDPAYPQGRLAFMLADAQVAVLVTQAQLRAALPAHAATVVCLDADWPRIAQESAVNPLSGATPEHLAYVMYTSGSTGRPKGVLGPHRGAVNRFAWMWETYPFGADEVCCQKTSLNFVDSVWELFGPLLRGVSVMILPNATVQALAAANVTRVVLVPSLLAALLDTTAALQHHLPHLRLWITSGEALSVELCRRFLRCMPHSVLLNLYGSSEVAADVTWYDTRALRDECTSVPIGRPLANTQIYLLDAHLHPVPLGVPGDLYVGGAGVARGYLHHPELTAERFIPHPFSAVPGARLYKTGDLARYLPDGNLEFLGRRDHQVKIRGYRIELGEIEAVLRQHPGVRETVVLARHDTPGETRLVAYIVTDQEQPPAVHALRGFLQQHLPEYMWPAIFVWLDVLPLMPNGKVDHLALLASGPASPVSEHVFVAPRTLEEETLAALWSQVLGLGRVGIADNFFELGGHSLLALRLLAQIEKTFGKQIPLVTLFQAPTVEQLACILRHPEWSPPTSLLVALQTRGSRPPFFWIHGDFSNFVLPRYLGQDQPLYALEHQSQDGHRARYQRVEDIAAQQLKEICTVQPQGPYLLGGFSFGSLVAFEAAQQLQRQGQEVALLFLLDPISPGTDTWSPHTNSALFASLPDIVPFRTEISRHLSNLTRLEPRERLDYVLKRVIGKIRARTAGIERVAKTIACNAYLGTGRRIPPALRNFYIIELYLRCARDYVPQTYPSPVLLFRAVNESYYSQSDWVRQVAREVDVYEIPGAHLDMLNESHVQVWAKKLVERLRVLSDR